MLTIKILKDLNQKNWKRNCSINIQIIFLDKEYKCLELE